ncbi:unnamed protein product, partial [Arabidopsis halleri]
MDAMNRSDMNSQSQLSDSSVASPISQPPLVSTPPMAYSAFPDATSSHDLSDADTEVFTVPGTQFAARGSHLSVSTGSLNSDGRVPYVGFTNLETGESSKER